jgi:oligopeptidase A
VGQHGDHRRQLKLRREEAQMLGYRNFAEVSLAPKMAESPQQVIAFLEDPQRVRARAEKDWDELRAFAAKELGLAELAPWDVAFAAESCASSATRSRRTKSSSTSRNRRCSRACSPSPKRCSAYDQAGRCAGLAQGRALLPRREPRRLARRAVLLDLYAREGKRGGAWMDDARAREARRHRADAGRLPDLQLLAPVGGKPACFTHDEVITLFHEFGHGLHHMLTRSTSWACRASTASNGMRRAAVAVHGELLLGMGRAVVDDGARGNRRALPRALFDKMLAAKNFQSGLMTLRQIVFSMFDMLLHVDFDPAGATGVNASRARSTSAST